MKRSYIKNPIPQLRSALISYFSFTKKELNGMLILFMLIIAMAFSPAAYKAFNPPKAYDYKDFDAQFRAFKAAVKHKKTYSYRQVKEEIETKELETAYFEFDPNGLPVADWKRLGLSDRQIAVIKNYQAKGGRFYRDRDVEKMYSISAAEYARLKPYIRIKSMFGKTGNDRQASPTRIIHHEEYKKASPAFVARPAISVELNQADSAMLETVRGIGPAFASRIIRYKNRLGGFYKKEQLLEVYGMDSVKYSGLKDQVIVNTAYIHRININTATFDELKRHPYLTFKQINAIIKYREQHGTYAGIISLEKIAILDKALISKIEPYISF